MFKVTPGAGKKVDEIIEALEEIGVEVYEVEGIEQVEKPVGSLNGRYEADLWVQWEKDDE